MEIDSPDESEGIARGFGLLNFNWCLMELGLLGVLIFVCVLFSIHLEEIVYHVLFSLCTFAVVRCVESANRIDERVSECGRFARACSKLHLRDAAEMYQRRLQAYRLQCRAYAQLSAVTLLIWIVVAMSYVYVIDKLRDNIHPELWMNVLVGIGTAYCVVTAVVKSWKSSHHDAELNVEVIAAKARDRSDRSRGRLQS